MYIPQQLERGKALRPPDRPPASARPKKARRLADTRLADSPAASAAHMPVPGVAAMEVDEEAVPSSRLTTLTGPSEGPLNELRRCSAAGAVLSACAFGALAALIALASFFLRSRGFCWQLQLEPEPARVARTVGGHRCPVTFTRLALTQPALSE